MEMVGGKEGGVERVTLPAGQQWCGLRKYTRVNDGRSTPFNQPFRAMDP